MKNKKMHKVTKDHTLVNLLVSTGELSAEEAKYHPRKNVLMRALGANNPIDVDIFDVRIENEDVLPLVDDEMNSEKEVESKEDKIIEESKPKEEILKSEYVTTFFFYRVKVKESLEDILNRFNMSYDEFTKLNKKTSIKENDLIQLKIK